MILSGKEFSNVCGKGVQKNFFGNFSPEPILFQLQIIYTKITSDLSSLK